MTKLRPIIFNGEMVRAILGGQKTQTRRICKPIGWRYEPVSGTLPHNWDKDFNPEWLFKSTTGQREFKYVRCPYGQIGDRLWVRETWQHSNFPSGPYDDDCDVFYRADYLEDPHGADGEKSPEGKYRFWKPAIHMPRAANRITLEITNVRVERLQDISRGDAMAEGCPFPNIAKSTNPREWYKELWGSINGTGSWEANPWVWVVLFEKVRS